ncbi:MAG: LuxR C-terminal-related transcriptional regulator [Polyangiaceae bacterium]
MKRRTSAEAVEAYRLEIDGEEYLLIGIPVGSPKLERDLTPVEATLIEGVLAGLSNRQLAEKRGTAVRTIANQLQTLYRKLGVGSRGELRRKLLAPRAPR